MELHYRHIKKILRAPRYLTKAEFISLWVEHNNLDDDTTDAIFYEMMNLKASAIYLGVDNWFSGFMVNVKCEKPVIWFCRNNSINYAIGFDFTDFIRALIQLKTKKFQMIDYSYEPSFYREYAKHLKWRLTSLGCKFDKRRFNYKRTADFKEDRLEITRLIALFIQIKSKNLCVQK